MATLIRGLTRRSEDKAAADALAAVRELENSFQRRNRLYKLIDEIMYLQHAVDVPKAYRKTTLEVRTHRPFQTVADISAALSTNAPTVHFAPAGDPDATSAQQNATKREHFFEASRRRMELNAKRALFRVWMHSLVGKGEAVMKVLPRRNRAWGTAYQEASAAAVKDLYGPHSDLRAADREYMKRMGDWKQQKAYPITSIDVPPESFYYVKGEDGFTVCAERKAVPYFETLVRLNASLNRHGQIVPEAMGLPQNDWQSVMSGTRSLHLSELWQWDKCTYVLQGPGDISGSGNSGLLSKEVHHHFGDPETHTLWGPYVHCYGITTSSRDQRFEGVSVLFAYLTLYPLLDSLYTMLHQGVYTFAFPYMTTDRMQGDGILPEPGALRLGPHTDDDVDETLDIQPGDILPPGRRFVDPPRVNMDVREAIQVVEGMLQEAHPGILTGRTNPGDSGYLANQAQLLASIKYDPIIQNAEFAQAEVVNIESRLIEEEIGEVVYVRGTVRGKSGAHGRVGQGTLSLGPDDLQGIHDYEVRLDAKKPVDEIVALRAHELKRSLGAETQQEMIEDLNGNAEEVTYGLILERLKQSQEVQGKITDDVLTAIGIVNQQRMAAAEAAFTAGQGAGQPGGNVGQPSIPGDNMPMIPTPQGNVTNQQGSIGPPQPRGPVGPTSGAPGPVPSPPANANPLPGQQ